MLTLLTVNEVNERFLLSLLTVNRLNETQRGISTRGQRVRTPQRAQRATRLNEPNVNETQRAKSQRDTDFNETQLNRLNVLSRAVSTLLRVGGWMTPVVLTSGFVDARMIEPSLGPKWPPRRRRGFDVYARLACRIPYDSLCFQPPAAAAPNWIPGGPPWARGGLPWPQMAARATRRFRWLHTVSMQNTV